MRSPILTVLVFTFLTSCNAICAQESNTEDSEVAKTESSREALDFFESKIRPLLLSRCVECHGDSDPDGELSLTSKAAMLRGSKLGPVVVPGKPKESLLISAINHDAFLKMPPKDKLPTSELLLLSKWVSMGAPWPESNQVNNAGAMPMENVGTAEASTAEVAFSETQRAFWSYQSLRKPVPPAIAQDEWSLSPIDAFVLEKLQANGLAPAKPTSKRNLIRRATFDLIGLPPTEEEIESFLADESPEAFEAVIDGLLASPRYGEKWGRHWLDVARFADSNGLDENIAYANAYRYRDYVIASFNRDLPFDRFVQEQIAGDLLEPSRDAATPDSLGPLAATGFLAIGAKMLAEDDPLKMQMDIIDEQLSTVCQAFMGMTIGCARCHDHKFDPIPTSDYYALAGIFKSTKTMENHKVVARWFERPLVSAAEQEVIRKLDAEAASIQASIAQLDDSCRERVASSIQNSIAAALMANLQFIEFQAKSKVQICQGMEQKEQSYAVAAGYALIEAEAFHRGTFLPERDNYGQGIGVVISKEAAYAEYDIDVEHAGRYAIEFRYAAAERRPLQLMLDGQEINPSILSEKTGSWLPENQEWVVADSVDLSPGKHVLRVESKKVIPHIDKIAIVLQDHSVWPFGDAPRSLSRVGAELGIDHATLSLWSNYLQNLKKRLDREESPSFFAAWLRLRDSKLDRKESIDQFYSDLESESSLRKQTPAFLREALLAERANSLIGIARVFSLTTKQILSNNTSQADANAPLREALLAEDSPLVGPKKEATKFYNQDERARLQQFKKTLAEVNAQRPNPPMAMGVTEAEPEDLRVHLRGSHLVFGKLAKRGFPQILASVKTIPIPETNSGRLELARWMTQPDHPLTSRVIANRVWHWHFRRGIVSSVDNFGLLGQKPTHPDLLDWLASDLVAHDWSIKHLHKTIMLSQTYQMGSQQSSRAAEVDPENELRWQFQRRRLTAEETRDSIIEVGTGLNTTMYGTLMKVENHTYVNSTGAGGVLDYSNARRSVYLPVIRSGVFEVLQTLDFPDPAMSSGERQVSTAAPQALLMMNSDLVQEQSRAVADFVMNASMDDGQRIVAAYRRILKRTPSAEEFKTTRAYVQAAQENAKRKSIISVPSNDASNSTGEAREREMTLWQGLCRVLLSSNEFSYVE